MKGVAWYTNPKSFRYNVANFALSTFRSNKSVDKNDDERDAYYASQAAYGSNDHHQRLVDRGYTKDDLSTDNTWVYNNGSKTLVGYRGTVDNAEDKGADAAIGVGLHNLHPAFNTAKAVGERAKAKYKNRIIYTGHSLGGTKAVEVGRYLGGKTIVFNPGTSYTAPLDTHHAKVYRTNLDYISYNTRGGKPTVYSGGHALNNFEEHFL